MTNSTQTNSRRIIIFDTTLRDGEQSPGASMNLAEKTEVALALARPGRRRDRGRLSHRLAGRFRGGDRGRPHRPRRAVCGLARCREADIDRAWEALRYADQPRIHVFLATSAIHREFKLKMGKEDIVRHAVASVKRAAGYCANVEFSPEDAARTESDFLCRVVEAAIEAGATTVNIPDTVGYATPSHMHAVIANLLNRVPNIDKAVISVHCHNDLGLAVANSLAAVEAGAGQVECTINGLGERAGNCSLEEVVMALRTRNDYYHAHTNVNTHRLVPASRLVANVTGIQVQRNKAIVGQNAFAHEAGIHQDGMLKERTTYEIMRPEDVGFATTELVLGKHSGRAALAARIKALGYTLADEQVNQVFELFKVLADKKKEIYDADIAALIEQEMRQAPELWSFHSYNVVSGTGKIPAVHLRLLRGHSEVATEVVGGDGPVDAVFLAIEQLTGVTAVCKDFAIHSVSVGKDAQAEVLVQLEHGGRIFRGRGVSTDSVEASARAFLGAVNRIAAAGEERGAGSNEQAVAS